MFLFLLLKTILKVKSGTITDLIFHELRRGDILSKIKDRQSKFFKKILELHDGDAIVKDVVKLCENDEMICYYKRLNDNNYERDIKTRAERIINSTASMCKYYVEMNFIPYSCIYNSFVNDYHRAIISRWRLSNHDLRIEKWRYSGVEREDRKCDFCNVVEDEEHVIFMCPRYNDIRINYQTLLRKNNNIKLFLSPSYTDIRETSELLHEVEAFRKS